MGTDNFDRANAANLGANWTRAYGQTENLTIINNAAGGAGAYSSYAEYFSAEESGNNQYAEVTLRNIAEYPGVILRHANNATSDYYCIFARNSTAIRMTRWDGGNTPTLLDITSLSMANNAILRAEANGTTVTIYVNGNSVGSYNSANLVGNFAGIYHYALTGNVAVLDDFSCGSLGAGNNNMTIGPVTDTGAGADALVSLAVRTGNIADTGSGVDTQPGASAVLPSLLDQASVADALQSLLAQFGLTDSGAGADAPVAPSVTVPTLSDNGAGNDSHPDGVWLLVPSAGIAWGASSPDADELYRSWKQWESANGVPVTIDGDPDSGNMQLSGNAYSTVQDFGNANTKTFTILQNKYAAGNNAVVYIRGSANRFGKWDASPDWQAYSGNTQQAWRYVQVRVDGAA